MKIKGILPALVTPLNSDETINVPVLNKLIHDLSEQGADGFYIGGATGEGLALRPGERKVLAEAAIAAADKNTPCIIQVASTVFSDAVDLAKHAEKAGAAAISATAPLFFSYDEDDVYSYYKTLAASVHIPLMVYYSPAANFRISADFARRLFEIDNVTAIKWTSTDFYQMLRLKDITNGEINILNGFDEMLLSGLSAGADGGIGSTYNYQLRHIRGVYDSFVKNEMQKAAEFQTKVNRVVSSFSGEPVIPFSKAVLECMGYAVGNAAFPMKRYSEDEKKRIFERVSPCLPKI